MAGRKGVGGEGRMGAGRGVRGEKLCRVWSLGLEDVQGSGWEGEISRNYLACYFLYTLANDEVKM